MVKTLSSPVLLFTEMRPPGEDALLEFLNVRFQVERHGIDP